MPPKNSNNWDSLREKIIGLGERSVHKSYYPELQQQINKLKRFRTLLDQTNDIIFLLDVSSHLIVDLNKSAFEQLGYSPNELLKMPIEDLIDPQELYQTKELFYELNKSREPQNRRTITTNFLKKNDQKIPVEISVSMVEFSDDLYAVIVARDITERKQAEKQINISLKEKEVLLKEIHHRVKNNMQIISSLLNLQSFYIDDKESFEVFKESQNRIKSMALIHEKLYQSKDLTEIDFAEYISNLVFNLFKSYSVNSKIIKRSINVEDALFDIDTSIPCGLIINELVSNSLKYAFPDGQRGEIKIDLRLDNGKSILTVSDNGIGLPEDVDFQNTGSLGLRLVKILVNQINGELHINKSEGTSFTIEFTKKLPYEERI